MPAQNTTSGGPMTMPAAGRVPTGWQCPVCLHVYSPVVSECRNCPAPNLAAVAPVTDMFESARHGQHSQPLEPLPPPSGPVPGFVPAGQLAGGHMGGD